MISKHINTVLLCALLASPFVLLSHLALEDWPFKKQIDTSEIDNRGYVQAELDNEVSAQSANFNDLRVISDQDIEVPYQVVVHSPRSGDRFYSSQVLDQSTDSLGRLMFIVDLGSNEALHSRLNITSNTLNFRRDVAVYGSDQPLSHDDSGWRLLTDSGYIFKFTDTTAGFTAGEGVVDYPQSTSRFLRVVVGGPTEIESDLPHGGSGEAISLSKAEVYRHEATVARTQTIDTPVQISEDTQERVTEVVADLGVEGINTSSIGLFSDDTNFNRSVTLQASSDGENWRFIKRDYIFKIEGQNFAGPENMTIRYPESNSRYLRVLVFNHDNQPVNFHPRAEVGSVLRTIVFEADPERSYELFYGNRNVRAPQYDLSRFFQYIEADNLPQVTLGTQVENPIYEPAPPPEKTFQEKYPYFLNLVLVFLTIIIGIIVFTYLRKYKKGGSEGEI